MNYQIEVQDIEPVQNMLKVLIQRGAKLKPFMRQAGEIMRASATKNFEEEGRPRWKALSPFTRKIYEGLLLDSLRETKGYKNLKRESTRERHEKAHVNAVMGGRKLLSGSGDLRKSIVLGQISDISAEVGSSLPYARIHQLGGTVEPKSKKALCIPVGGGNFIMLKRAVIPARPYLTFGDGEKVTIIRALDAFMLRGMTNG